MSIHNIKIFKSQPELLNGNVQIIACAGSGKTEFVSERIAYQIYKGIAKPENVAAFTFTEKAAEELKFRVRAKVAELLGKQPDIGDMYIGTIHAFAFRLLQDYIPKYRAYDMLDEVSQMAFLSSIKKDIDVTYLTNSLSKRFQKPWGRNYENWVFKTFLRDVDIFREEGLQPEDAVIDSFKNAFKTYLQKLDEKRFLDFSAILRIAVDALESNPAIKQRVQQQFQYFTVDEYQDVNPIQEKLIQLVSGKNNVCVVGDDDQSIYQWRGADVSNIISFRKRYKNVNVYQLEINRRSADGIVKTADEFISLNNPHRLAKSIKDKGVKSEKGDLYKVVFEKQEEEIEWVISKIKDLIGKEYIDSNGPRKLQYSDFAFLFRSIANEADPYIQALKDADIPLIYSGVGGLFDTTEISSFRRIFEYMSECDKDIVYDDNFLRNIHNDLQQFFSIKFSDFKKGILSMRENAKKVKRLSLQGVFLETLALMGLSNQDLHDTEDDVLLYNLGRLSQAISDYEDSREYLTFNSIKDFIWFIRLHAENSYDSGNTNAMAGYIDAVQIMTMHGTKGLGFPVVFMPSHFRQNRQPDFGPTFIDTTKFNVSRYLSHVNDERRLYYVALTRSKKFLFVTTAEHKIEGISLIQQKERSAILIECRKKFYFQPATVN
jgi:DNA helicase II / ATP-dependent DNA helicase PcrA